MTHDVPPADQIVRFERAFGAVEQPKLLALARKPHNDSAVDLIQIEGMRRMPHADKREVRSIDSIQDLLLVEQMKVVRNRAG